MKLENPGYGLRNEGGYKTFKNAPFEANIPAPLKQDVLYRIFQNNVVFKFLKKISERLPKVGISSHLGFLSHGNKL